MKDVVVAEQERHSKNVESSVVSMPLAARQDVITREAVQRSFGLWHGNAHTRLKTFQSVFNTTRLKLSPKARLPEDATRSTTQINVHVLN